MKKRYDNKLKYLEALSNNLSYDIDDIFDDIYSLDTRLVQCEQYTRRESLVISGIPDYIPQSDLEYKVLDIVNGVGVKNVSSFEISACHRLFKKPYDRYPAKTVVRFTNRKIVESCLFHQYKLEDVSNQMKMNLRFYQSLCNTNKDILKMCKQLSEYGIIKEFKVIRGTIRIFKFHDNKQYKIGHPNVLYKMFKTEFYDFEDLYLN